MGKTTGDKIQATADGLFDMMEDLKAWIPAARSYDAEWGVILDDLIERIRVAHEVNSICAKTPTK